MSLDDTSVAIGQLQAASAATQKDVAEIKTDQKSQNEKLDRLLAYQDRQRGAWGSIITISTAVSTVVGLAIAWFHK